MNSKIIKYLSLLAAIVYSSWILGFFLTPEVAWNGPASDLAAKGQQFREIYFVGDLLCTLIVVACSIFMARTAQGGKSRIISALYGLFGALMLGATLNPLACTFSSHCADDTYTVHMVSGILATILLLASSIIGMSNKKVWWKSTDFFLIVVWVVSGVVDMVLSANEFSVGVSISQRIALMITAYFIWRVPTYYVRYGKRLHFL